jgi:hypothetical protein
MRRILDGSHRVLLTAEAKSATIEGQEALASEANRRVDKSKSEASARRGGFFLVATAWINLERIL